MRSVFSNSSVTWVSSLIALRLINMWTFNSPFLHDGAASPASSLFPPPFLWNHWNQHFSFEEHRTCSSWKASWYVCICAFTYISSVWRIIFCLSLVLPILWKWTQSARLQVQLLCSAPSDLNVRGLWIPSSEHLACPLQSLIYTSMSPGAGQPVS